MKEQIFDFITRRFSQNCHWLDGNCYYFAVILKNRFPSGTIYYDVIYSHFVFGLNGCFYDWSGEIEPQGKLVEWDKFGEYDELVKQRVIKACIE